VDKRKLNKKTNVSVETKEGLCFLTVKIKEAVELF
jgi:hypothetical protein